MSKAPRKDTRVYKVRQVEIERALGWSVEQISVKLSMDLSYVRRIFNNQDRLAGLEDRIKSRQK